MLGKDQYPDTFEKAQRILSNYQITKVAAPYRASPTTREWRFCNTGEAAAGEEQLEEVKRAAEAAASRQRDRQPKRKEQVTT